LKVGKWLRLPGRTAEPPVPAPDSLDGQALGCWLAAAGSLQESPRHVCVGARVYSRTFQIRHWPKWVVPGHLYELTAGIPGLRVAWHLVPAEIQWNMLTRWKLRRLEQSVNETAGEVGGLVRPEEAEAAKALRYLHQQTQFNRADLFDLWCFITIQAESLEALDRRSAELRQILRNRDVSLTPLPLQQAHGFVSGLVSALPDPALLSAWPGRLADCTALSALHPFLHGSLSEGRGLYLGNRVAGGSFTFLDLASGEEAKNFIVLGAGGEGKSTFLKAMVTGFLLLQPPGSPRFRVLILDVDGEYRRLCEEAGGVWIDHTLASGRYADPLAVPPPIGDPKEDAARLQETTDHFLRVVSLLAGGMTPAQATAADRALVTLRRQAGIDPDLAETWDRPVTIHHWYRQLQTDHSEAAQSLVHSLWRYFEGSLSRMFAEADGLDLDRAPLIVLHVSQSVNDETDAHTGAVKMAMALHTVWQQIKRERVRGELFTAVVADEGQRLLVHPGMADWTNMIATTARKWNSLLILASNKPSAVFETSGGQGLWENSPNKVLFYMEDSALRAVAEKAHIPASVLDQVRRLHKTHQFMVRVGGRFDLLRVELPPEELELYRTRGLRAGGGGAGHGD